MRHTKLVRVCLLYRLEILIVDVEGCLLRRICQDRLRHSGNFGVRNAELWVPMYAWKICVAQRPMVCNQQALEFVKSVPVMI